MGINKVPFETESYDNSNCFNTTTNRFVATVAGNYHFSSTVRGTVGSGDTYWVYLYKNGALAKCGHSMVVATTYDHAFVVSGDIQLAANDYVEVFFNNGSGGVKSGTNGAAATFFDGYLVSQT